MASSSRHCIYTPWIQYTLSLSLWLHPLTRSSLFLSLSFLAEERVVWEQRTRPRFLRRCADNPPPFLDGKLYMEYSDQGENWRHYSRERSYVFVHKSADQSFFNLPFYSHGEIMVALGYTFEWLFLFFAKLEIYLCWKNGSLRSLNYICFEILRYTLLFWSCEIYLMNWIENESCVAFEFSKILGSLKWKPNFWVEHTTWLQNLVSLRKFCSEKFRDASVLVGPCTSQVNAFRMPTRSSVKHVYSPTLDVDETMTNANARVTQEEFSYIYIRLFEYTVPSS